MRRFVKVAGMGVAALLAAIALVAFIASADAPPGPFFQGFETDTSAWFDASNGGDGSITQEPSGYTNGGGYASGIASAAGGFHARLSGDQPCIPPDPCFGPFTRWGGYSQTFPIGGYRTLVDIYLDVDWAASHADTRFDFSSSINDSTTGAFLRDFVFNAGTNPAGDLSTPGFYIGASTNAFRNSTFPENTCPSPSDPPNSCRTPVHIETSGWYTFRHTFRDDGGFLAVDFDIFPLGNNTSVASWTIHTGDCFSPCVPGSGFGVVGGNRYGWFVNEEIPDLAIDDSARTGLNIDLTPATATNPVGTSHTVTATVTSTDADGHPSPGPGVAIEFDVISGPNTGQTSHPTNSGTCSPSNCTTDASGQVSWTYTSNGTPGTDIIQACFPDRPPNSNIQRPEDEARQCRTVTKEWTALVSTPGKVTGGGQIDPVTDFVSKPGTQADATFGFMIMFRSGDTAPEGNLEYDDHTAGVRIKATSYDLLLISAPGGSCPHTSGSQHAKFTGTAQVNGAPESLTVEVDDCGEPGSSDTFSITAGAYNASGTLVSGGNIQIHQDSSSHDTDGDSFSRLRNGFPLFSDDVEADIGTNPGQACAATSTPDDEITQAQPEDFNDDGFVDVTDISRIAGKFGLTSNEARFSRRFDLNGDGSIDISDIAIVGGIFGTICTPPGPLG